MSSLYDVYMIFLLHFTEKLETDNHNSTEQVQRLLAEKHTKSVEIALLSKELKGLKRSVIHHEKFPTQDSQNIPMFKPSADGNPLDKYAITIVNANGKVSSPFMKQNKQSN